MYRRLILVAVLLASVAASTAVAQQPSAYKVPRTEHGHPDFQGIWATAFLTMLIASRRRLTEAPAEPAFRRVMALNYANSTAFLLFIGIQMLRG